MSGNAKIPACNYSTIRDRSTMVQEKADTAQYRAENARNKANTDVLEGWWISCLDSRNVYGYDSVLRVLPTSGNRVFRGGITEHVSAEDIWDVSELMEEMRDHDQHRDKVHSNMLRGVPMPTLPRYSTPHAWLSTDRGNGFISVYDVDASSSVPTPVPCKASLLLS